MYTVHMLKQFYFKQFSLVHSLDIKTILFPVILFSISTQFNSVWPIDSTLSGLTTPGQSVPWSNGNEEVLRILQMSSITGTLPSNCLVSFSGILIGGGLTPVQGCSWCILQPQPIGRWNTWNFTIVCKLLVLVRKGWYQNSKEIVKLAT